MKQLVYLSGPMGGCTYEEMSTWRAEATKLLDSPSLKCISPTRSFSATYQPPETDKWINRRDYTDCVRSQCVLVNFQGMKHISIGTVMEIAWAYQRQIPVICICEPDGPQNHPMLKDSITHEVKSLKEAVLAVKEILSEE
jgi:nucleoside 2-deoxyribosyltransferase